MAAIDGHLESRKPNPGPLALQEVFQFFAATLHVLLAMGFPLHRWSGCPKMTGPAVGVEEVALL